MPYLPRLFAILLAIGLFPAAFAANPSFIELQLEDRQARLEELTAEAKRLNRNIEGKIARLESRFAGVKDSQESGVTVHQTKERLITGLGELSRYYAEQRDLFLTEAKQTMPRADPELLKKIAARYDGLINERIAQITRLERSLASPNPESSRGSGQQIARRTLKQRNATRAIMQGIIQRLQQENETLQRQLAAASAHDQAIIKDTIAHNEMLIKTRQSQLAALDADEGSTPTRAVSKSEALQLRKWFEASAQDIKEDSYRLSNLAIEYAQESAAIDRLKAELAKQ